MQTSESVFYIGTKQPVANILVEGLMMFDFWTALYSDEIANLSTFSLGVESNNISQDTGIISTTTSNFQ